MSESIDKKIIDYCYSQIDRQKLTDDLKQKYAAYLENENTVAMYYTLEEFISTNTYPVIKHETDKPHLREKIRKEFDIHACSRDLRIIFLPLNDQKIETYRLFLEDVETFIIRAFGILHLAKLTAMATANTPAKDITVAASGLEYDKFLKTAAASDMKDVVAFFKKIYLVLHDDIAFCIGVDHARSIILNTYENIKQKYDFSITSYIFDIVPEGIVDYEKVVFMSRENLEKLVQQRTVELEEAKIHLEEKVALRTAELSDAKSRVETILTSIGDAVFAVDLNGQVILMNPIAEELSGVPFSEALGKHYTQVFRFISEEQPNIPYGPFVETVIANGTKQTLAAHTQLVQKSGKRISVSDSAAPIMDQSGKIIGCVVVFRDFGRERELEKAKDTFLSIAAHQLRTPLGSMRWNLEMLLSGDIGAVDAEVKKVIGQIYENDTRLINLVNDLLNVSRIDQKRVVYEAIETDIIALIYNIIKEVEGLAQKRSISLNFTHDAAQNFVITVDKKRFIEAVENLLSNAIKYSNFGGPVSISVERLANQMIQISITDSGIGIPEKDKANIFSKFFRAENAIKSETEGTGLGLYVVKSYIEDMGGKVGYNSVENKGTTFVILLPDK